MKKLFMGLVYISVALSSLFVTVWFMAYFGLFEPAGVAPVPAAAAAEELKSSDSGTSNLQKDTKNNPAGSAGNALESTDSASGDSNTASDSHAVSAGHPRHTDPPADVPHSSENNTSKPDKPVSRSTASVSKDNGNTASEKKPAAGGGVSAKAEAGNGDTASAASEQPSAASIPAPSSTSDSGTNTDMAAGTKPEAKLPSAEADNAERNQPAQKEEAAQNINNEPPKELSSTTEEADTIPPPPNAAAVNTPSLGGLPADGQNPASQNPPAASRKAGVPAAQGKASGSRFGIGRLQQRISDLINVAKNPYSLDTKGRNPFKSFREKIQKKKEKLIILTPAERYALNDMKLVGVKWTYGFTPPKAIFKAPDGKKFYLQKNDRIGATRGIVYRIREDEVVIVQPKSESESADDTDISYIPIIMSMNRSVGSLSL